MDFGAVEMQFSSYKERSNRFHRNAASGYISIPVCTHISTSFLVCNGQKSLLLIQSVDLKKECDMSISTRWTGHRRAFVKLVMIPRVPYKRGIF
jgi:hypothetical protein